MNINTRAKALIGAVAIGGAAIAMGGAFTAGGVEQTAPTSQFIGGTAAQSISGATLSQISYTASADLLTISEVQLVLGGEGADKNVSITFDENGTPNTSYTCDEVIDGELNPTGTYDCTTTGTAAANSTTTSLDVQVVSKSNVTVAS